jgi:hypothetical protein
MATLALKLTGVTLEYAQVPTLLSAAQAISAILLEHATVLLGSVTIQQKPTGALAMMAMPARKQTLACQEVAQGTTPLPAAHPISVTT